MTFRVFFCAGGCGLLPPGGRFGTNAAGLPCPGDFFGTGAAWAVRLLLHCSWESLYSRHCLGSLIFSTLPPGISLEQSGLFRTILQAFLWSGHWLK